MTQTHAPTPAAAPIAAPRAPRERRMRTGQVGLALVLIVIGALGAAALVTSVAATDAYLAVGRPVAYGAPLTEDDLVTVQINNAPGLAPIPAGDLAEVVGSYAAVTLVPGTLLVREHLTEQAVPGPGQQVLGIAVRSDRVPARRPGAGDPVLLVATASQSGSLSGPEETGDAPTFRATVLGVSEAESSGIGTNRTITVDVLVDEADGPAVARLAAADRIAILLLPGE